MDSSKTSNFLLTKVPVVNRSMVQASISSRLLDESSVQSSHTVDLDVIDLAETVGVCHIVPGLISHSLSLVVKLYTTGCNVTVLEFGTGVKVRYRNRMTWP